MILFRFLNTINDLELEEKYERKMQALRDELELRRKTGIHEIEEVGIVCILHKHAFSYYSCSVRMLKSTL